SVALWSAGGGRRNARLTAPAGRGSAQHRLEARLLEVAVVGQNAPDAALLADQYGGAVDERPALVRAGLVQVEGGAPRLRRRWHDVGYRRVEKAIHIGDR